MKKISILLMLIFSIIGFGSVCFAEENLTLNEFKTIMKNAGANVDNIEIPNDLQTILSTKYPLVIKDTKNNCIRIYPTIHRVYTYNGYQNWKIYFGLNNKVWTIGLSDNITGSKANYSSDLNVGSYPSSGSIYAYRYDFNTNAFVQYEFAKIYNNHLYNYGISIGCEFDINSETLEGFQSIARLKNYLFNNVLFSGQNEIYYNKQNIFYRFNGVYVGDNNVFIPGATCISVNDTYFEYMSNSTYNDVFFEIQDCPLSEITTWSSTDYETLDFSSYFTTRLNIGKYGSSVKQNIENQKLTYDYLSKFMESGHIYRLVVTTRVNNSSGDTLNTYYCTSCFFSLNDWKSNAITVKNISKLIAPDDSDLVIDNPGGTTGGDDLTIKDLNDNISSSIDNVNKNIQDTILGTPDESGERKGGLVGNLLEGLWKGLVALIIPDSETLGKWITDQTDKLSANAGFLTYSKTFWLSMCNLITNSSGDSDCIFVLPEFKVPGFNTVIWQEQNINLTSYFKNNENEVIKGFYTTYIVLVSGISIFYFCQYLWSLWDSIISGTHQITPEQNEDMQISHDFDMDNGMKTTSYTGRDINGQRYRLRYHYNSRKR